MTGTVFDIKEFAVYDGPGIRTTVFMKGCPLRCRWCHNPEGLIVEKQLMVSVAACTQCGECKKRCMHEKCVACGECVPYCRQGLRRICGTEYTPEELALRLERDRSLWESTGGGVTFSGGEPLLQWRFVKETLGLMPGVHSCIETSGHVSHEVFADAVDTLDTVIMDIKHTDSAEHRRWTGAGNERILENARYLLSSDTPCIIRLPLIPTVNDTESNKRALAEIIRGSKNLIKLEILPYHKTAGAKYSMAGMEYDPGFDTETEPDRDIRVFEETGIPVTVL